MIITTPVTKERASLRPPNFGVTRRRDDRVVAGLASGIADAIGVDAAYVRAGFVSLLAASGLGGVLYMIGWLATASNASDGPGASDPLIAASTNERNRTIGAGLVFLGFLLALSESGLWLGASSGAVTLTAFGLATLWAQSDGAQRSRWFNALLRGETLETGRREFAARATAGVLLIVVGLTIFFTTTDALRAAGSVVLAVFVTGGGVLLVLGPWVFSLATDLREERLERIRSEEREDMAAHLHDSVLQTLALIQRSKDPEEQAILARIQERELRTWLFGSENDNGGMFAQAIENAAAGIEKDHQVAVEVVTVGDCHLEPGADALVKAAREAMVNAAKHSGARTLSVFAEVQDDGIEVYVTDQGVGFDLDGVAEDRHGISDSILARMTRHGGSAEIDSEPGEGTEVHLRIPRSPQ